MKRIPTITAQQMARVDRLMIHHYRVTIVQMMEHDAVALVGVATKILKILKNKKIVVAFGSGGNGGGGLAAARMFSNAGAKVSLVTSADIKRLTGPTAQMYKTCKTMGIKLVSPSSKIFNSADLILDALLGYSVKGAARGKVAEIIELINTSQAKVLSNDLPSGLDPNKGSVHGPIVKANATLTVALPKVGLFKSDANLYTGKLFLGDITVPRSAYTRLGIKVGDVFKGISFVSINN